MSSENNTGAEWTVKFKLLGKKSLNSLFLSTCKTFNSREITVEKSSRSQEKSYFKNDMICSSGMHLATENFLQGNLLRELVTKKPEEVLLRIREYQEISDEPHYFLIAADVCRYLADHASAEKAIHFHLSSYEYCYRFVSSRKKRISDSDDSSYDISTATLLQIFNESIAGIFRHLKVHNLLGISQFRMQGAEKQVFVMGKPVFHLSVPVESILDFSLCSDYEVKGLLMINRHPGVGVPLVAKISPESGEKFLKTPGGLTIPVTMLIRPETQKNGEITLTPVFLDTTISETFHVEKERLMPGNWPLARDFTTPFACFLNNLEQRNLLSVMLNPWAQDEVSGLYMVEPYQKEKIPVVFIHGLMSSPETWGQMFNSLRNNPSIRKRYQFWFYSYSTGFPILYSAGKLRQALFEIQKKFCTTPEAAANFEKMVIVGHSMGGLVTRLLLQNDPWFLAQSIAGKNQQELQEMLKDDWNLIKEYAFQKPLPFVHRAVFMAVPHKGSEMAKNALAQLGINLTKLPEKTIRKAEIFERLYRILHPDAPEVPLNQIFTGISNLNPEHRLIRALGVSPIKEDVICHSIIGNQKADHTPGGSDGVVEYSSSHLEQAVSECIVKSNHSVHQRPAAFRELLRILLLHLKEQ